VKTRSNVRAFPTLLLSLVTKYLGKIGKLLKPKPATPGFANLRSTTSRPTPLLSPS
jgi:hypothetical protein